MPHIAQTQGSIGFFKTLFDQSPFAMQIFSSDGDVVKCNQVWDDIWGESPAKEIYNIFTDIQAKESGITAAFELSLSGKSTSLKDVRYAPSISKSNSGGVKAGGRYFNVRMLPLSQAVSQVEGVVCILEDVTEQRRMEEEQQSYREKLEAEVQARTRHLEALLQFSTELTSLDEPKSIYGYITSWAKTILKFDYSTLFILSPENNSLTLHHTIGFPDTMVGSFTLLKDQGLPSLVARTKQHAVIEDFDAETRVFIPDIIFTLGISSALAVPMLNKNRLVGVLIGHSRAKRTFTESDISLYQNAANQAAVAITNMASHQSLLHSEERFKLLFENSNDAIFIAIAENCRIIDCNQKALELDGYSREELVAIKMNNLFPDEEQDAIAEGRKLLFETGSFNNTGNLHHLTKDNHLIPVEISSALVEIRERKLVMHTVRDISQRKALEKEQKKATQKSHRARKMEAIGLMASGVAHDLNNILTGVVSYPELILMNLPDDSPIRPELTMIMESGQRAADVVSDLLTVARGAATVKHPTSLNELIRKYMNSPEVSQLCTLYPQVRVSSSLRASCDTILCSEVHIQKLFMNLLANGLESIEGVGEVVVETAEHTITRQKNNSMEAGNYLLLTIRDSGTGISEKNREHIFDPFYTTKKMGRSGTGLGLAVVWNTVDDHNGQIRVKSNDHGTVFSILFPLIIPETSTNDAMNGAIKGARLDIPFQDLRGTGSILVVDDEQMQRQVAVRALKMLGYEASAVSSGEEAVERLRENRVDVIMLDMIMDPGISGRETYEQIIRIHPGQKAIVVSGYSDSVDIRHLNKLGVHSLLKKPYNVEELGKALLEVLGE